MLFITVFFHLPEDGGKEQKWKKAREECTSGTVCHGALRLYSFSFAPGFLCDLYEM